MTSTQTCYPAEWFAPLPFNPPWEEDPAEINWYQKASHTVRPDSTYRSTMSGCGAPSGCRLVGFRSYPTTPVSTCTSGPNAEYNMTHFAAGKDQGHGNCSDSKPCGVFEMCDYRFGNSGVCQPKPRFGV